MLERPSFDVFLAHNSQDKPQVRKIAEELKNRRLRPWIDEEQIPPGRSFQDEIQQAIPNVKSAAIFIGPKGLGKWETMELRVLISQCINANIPVIPVLLPGTSEEIMNNLLFLRELSWVSFTDGVDDPKALNKLVWGIEQQKKEPVIQTPIPPTTNKVKTKNKWFAGAAVLTFCLLFCVVGLPLLNHSVSHQSVVSSRPDQRVVWKYYGEGGGSFKLMPDGQWQDISNDGKVKGIFKQVVNNDDFVELDPADGRDYSIRIYNTRLFIKGGNFSNWTEYYQGSWES